MIPPNSRCCCRFSSAAIASIVSYEAVVTINRAMVALHLQMKRIKWWHRLALEPQPNDWRTVIVRVRHRKEKWRKLVSRYDYGSRIGDCPIGKQRPSSLLQEIRTCIAGQEGTPLLIFHFILFNWILFIAATEWVVETEERRESSKRRRCHPLLPPLNDWSC